MLGKGYASLLRTTLQIAQTPNLVLDVQDIRNNRRALILEMTKLVRRNVVAELTWF